MKKYCIAAVVLATNIVSRVSEQKQILAVAEQTALEKATEEYGEGCYVSAVIRIHGKRMR